MTDWIVTVRSAAKADIRQVRDWYDSEYKGLGKEFLTSIAQGFLRLRIAPDAHPFYFREYRRLVLNRFPYKLFYVVQGNRVIVMRVLHTAQDHKKELK